MNVTNYIYRDLLTSILNSGEELTTRNARAISCIDLPNTRFTEFPLVTVRKTAAMKAIREMEWFMSGQEKCPEELQDWWKGQLTNSGYLLDGYSRQLRQATTNHYGATNGFDQVYFILNELKKHPHSRRLLMSIWNPGEMANITETNGNQNTPTCCHSIVVQFFVRGTRLHMKTYQRSADMLLGVPHNWVQSWAMLLYFAYHSDLEVGSMTWMWGDAHIYQEESHQTAAKQIIEAKFNGNMYEVDLVYAPEEIVLDSYGVPVFKASDFTIVGEVPEPFVTGKIKLL